MYSVHSVDNTGTLPVGRCAHAVNIQSALGVAVFVAMLMLVTIGFTRGMH